MDNLLMSRKEPSRWEVMQRLAEKRMSQPEAGRSLNLSTHQLPSERPTYALRKAHVTLGVNPQTEITILYHAKSLAYTLFMHLAKQAQIVSIKQLDRALNAMPLPPTPPPDHPCPRRFATPLSTPTNLTLPAPGDILSLG